MDDNQRRFEDKIDRLHDRLDKMNEILIKNTMLLDEHQRRSVASESRLDLLEKRDTFISNMIRIVTIAGGILVFLSQILPLIRLLIS